MSPSRRARAFIIATKRASLPWPTYEASASAASFALATRAASSRSRTVRCSPATSPAEDSPTEAASGLTVTSAFKRVCSSVSSTVISFVMLAIGTRAAALCASSTSPVEPFSTIQARPLTCGAAPSAGAASTRAAAAMTTALTGPRFYSADADPLPDLERIRVDVRIENE